MKKVTQKKQLIAMSLVTTGLLMMHTEQVAAQEETTVSEATTTPSHTVTAANESETVAVTSETPVQSKGMTLGSELDSTNVTKVWADSQQGAGTVTAVLDEELNVKHDIFSNTNLEAPKVKSEDDLNALKNSAKIDYGKWISSKVIFTHNYLKNNDDVAGTETHGSHVSGIAVGETTKAMENGLKMTGVAPKSQLIFMKVIGGSDELKAKAIVDAINLGADSVNMSYGKGGGSKSNLHPDLIKAIQLAKEKGVFLVAGAGNDYAFGGAFKKPLAENPDFGVAASPGLSEDIISVAAYYNPNMYSEYLTTSTDKKVALSTSQGLVKGFEKGKSYQFVDAKFGRVEDFKTIDSKGKIALIQRGEIDFANKIKNAIANEAAGILIYNNLAEENTTLSLSGELAKIPSGFISQEDGQALLKNNNQTLTFNKDFQFFKNPGGNQIASFSSWGLTADGHLKPDVSAPGGNTYSAGFEGNNYEMMNGTSAAAPHVAGLVNLLKPIYQKRFPTKTPQELAKLIKQIMMSSATAVFNEQEKAYVSPRQQGAGLVDASKTATAIAYVTDKDDNSKIHLGDVKGTFNLTAKIHNLSETPKTFYYTAHVATDKVEGKHFALAPKHLLTTEVRSVTVPANTTLDVTVPVDMSQFHDDLMKQMPNGYFLDGFIRFMEAPNGSELMSIPFIGFRGLGKFADLAAMEKSIYETPQKTFYYERPDHLQDGEFELDDLKEFKSQSFTTLLSQYGSWGYVQESQRPGFSEEESMEFRSTTVLGTYEKSGSKDVKTMFIKDGKPYLAISPNGDGVMDTVEFRGTVLRNVKGLKAKVYRQSDLEKPIWESSEVAKVYKNYSELIERTGTATVFENTRWDGKDQNGLYAGDGNYIYRIVYTPVSEGAKEQYMDFYLSLNTVAPTLPTSAIYDANNRLVTVGSAQQSQNNAPIFRSRLAYSDMEDGMPVIRYIEANQDGTFSIPKTTLNEAGESVDLTVEQLTYVVEDRAGNYSHVKLTELLEKGKQLPESDGKNTPGKDKDQKELVPNVTEKPMQSVIPKVSLLNRKSGENREKTKLENTVRRSVELPQTSESSKSITMLGIIALGLSFVLNVFPIRRKNR